MAVEIREILASSRVSRNMKIQGQRRILNAYNLLFNLTIDALWESISISSHGIECILLFFKHWSHSIPCSLITSS